ncbi:NUDIX hydrolase [Solemya velum gill symbiont]|uniref:NUDIX hydrolase n=1 Tax=Solemya velum gill symbiont TaxID=2340 RepID=UPI000996EF8B|nr:DUF4743 domain-containing protein [Solemya velum gill symbiont]OOY52062.1 hypothetical protein BOV97_06730 [Solemya velum gill symbiont]OOY56164.1 hypothetical protein BOV99_05735 [Solemya velum gill symbiont]OOY57407.1 hypothetical protein BOW00_05535 [Solemya velum gill symbiont]OOY60288.1 hypothetical protein BOW02_06085 [Solemya velum gill symbiont]OOY62439.1 hypothetical protein BOW04_06450 [Solemya velum gill symbiont]
MSYLRHIHSNHNFHGDSDAPRFLINGEAVGWIRPDMVSRLLDESIFESHDDHAFHLHPDLDTFDKRSDALHELVLRLHAEGKVNLVMNEPYPVTASTREESLCVIDRPVAGIFGLKTYGQHLNGFVRKADGVYMWIGRRAKDKPILPGKLDQLVAGGLPYGISLEENLYKECYEEAGIPVEMASRSVPVGVVSYDLISPRGIKQELLYCYDLELAEDFEPVCTDGEVDEFLLLPIEEVAQMVRDTEEFKPNCNLVIIDFLIRHGFLQPDERDYVALVSGLRSSRSDF